MRKILVGLFVVALVALLLAGCKAKPVAPAQTPSTTSTEPLAKDIAGFSAVEKDIAPQDLDTMDKDAQAIEDAFK